MPTVSEISARLSGDNSNFRSVMSDSEAVAGRTGQSILKKLDLRSASMAIAAAVGFNINLIAENFARGIAMMSKETEDQYKRLEILSAQVADASIANMRSRLTAEQAYQLALEERERLEKRIAENDGASLEQQLRLKEDQLALERNIAAAREAEDRAQADRDRRAEVASRNRQRIADATRDALRSEMKLSEQIAATKQEIVDLEGAINSGRLSEANAAELSNTLTERKIELLKLESEQSQAIAKAVNDALDAHQKITKELETQTGTPSDRPTTKISKGGLTQAEGDAIAEKMTAAAYAAGIGGNTQSRIGAREIQDASDATLKEIIRRNQNELNLRQLNPGGPSDIEKIYPILQLKNEIAAISEELGLRTSIRNNVSRLGVEGARRAFEGNPLIFDRLVEQFTGQAEKLDKTNKLLERMNEKLAGGIRVRAVTTPGTPGAIE